MLTKNLVKLASDIQQIIKEYQITHPKEKRSREIQKYVLGVLMVKSKGNVNPESLIHMISLEQSVYTPDTDIMNWI